MERTRFGGNGDDCGIVKRINRTGGLLLLSLKSAAYAALVFTCIIGGIFLLAAVLSIDITNVSRFIWAAKGVAYITVASLAMSAVTIIPNLVLLVILKEKLEQQAFTSEEQLLRAGERHGLAVYKYSLIPFFIAAIPAFPVGVFIIVWAILITMPLLLLVAYYAGRYTVRALVELMKNEVRNDGR